jgi:hypothetical protein
MVNRSEQKEKQMKMFHVVGFAGLVGFGCALSACGGGLPVSAPNSAVPVVATASPDSGYLNQLNGVDPSISSDAGGDANLVSIGQAVCGDWTEGDNAYSLAEDAISGVAEGTTSLTDEQMGAIITAATENYCAVYEPQWAAFVADNS